MIFEKENENSQCCKILLNPNAITYIRSFRSNKLIFNLKLLIGFDLIFLFNKSFRFSKVYVKTNDLFIF